jgi:hypothetical protein
MNGWIDRYLSCKLHQCVSANVASPASQYGRTWDRQLRATTRQRSVRDTGHKGSMQQAKQCNFTLTRPEHPCLQRLKSTCVHINPYLLTQIRRRDMLPMGWTTRSSGSPGILGVILVAQPPDVRRSLIIIPWLSVVFHPILTIPRTHEGRDPNTNRIQLGTVGLSSSTPNTGPTTSTSNSHK